MIRIMAAVAGAVLIAFAMVEVVRQAVPGASGAARGETITVPGETMTVPGARHGPSPPVPNRSATAGCRVRYAANTWNNGFIANVTINNTSSTAIRGWRLQWAWPGRQQVAGVWNATMTQNGTNMTARNATWNPAIAPGGRVVFGFQGTYGRTNTAPAWFALNGTSCAVG